MLFYHVRKIDIADNVAVGQHDIILFGSAYERKHSDKRLHTGTVQRRARGSERRDIRRKYLYTAASAGKIPVLAGAEMIHKRLIVIMGYNPHMPYPAVYHIGKGEIYKAVAAAERHRSHCAHAGKIRYVFIVYVGEDYSYYRHLALPPSELRDLTKSADASAPSGTRMPAGISIPLPTSVSLPPSSIRRPITAPAPTDVPESIIE